MKTKLIKCIICKTKFERATERFNTRRKKGVMPKNRVTCSSKCSKLNYNNRKR